MTGRSLAVAIPARDEAALIGRCLDGLAMQKAAGAFAVVVLANDCADETARIALRPRGLDIHVIEQSLPLAERGAGQARRVAMATAAKIADIILTTDADCIADPDWIAAHRTAFAAGVDAVAGRVSGDWAELQHQPAEALAIGALEWEYLELLARAEALFDPREHDPAPRHVQCCGANLGITRAMLERVGGVPQISTGEDRALITAVEMAGGRVRHDPGPHVTASARITGRAVGGMADALAARVSPDYRSDEQFVPVNRLLERWKARREGGQGIDIAPMRLRPDELAIERDRLRELIQANE